MKKSIVTISAIIITLSIGILMSCNSGNNGANNQTPTDSSIKKMEQATPEANKEVKESHEVHKPGGGPHQGIIEEAGEKNHMEMGINGKDVVFYPLDELTNPVGIKGWTGKAVFQYKDGSSKSIDLMMMDGALTAMDANSGKAFTAIATLTLTGQPISARFSSEGSMENHKDDRK